MLNELISNYDYTFQKGVQHWQMIIVYLPNKTGFLILEDNYLMLSPLKFSLLIPCPLSVYDLAAT